MDWAAWARRFEQADQEGFVALFAEGGRFSDPVTPWTTDVAGVAEGTEAIFPDWEQQVDRILGGEGWAFFEWTGTGTFHGGGPAVPVVVHGATVVEVDGAGLVTSWRDYLDTAEPLGQIQAAEDPGT